MKNKKANIAVVLIIIVIAAVTVSVATWIVAKKIQTPNQNLVTYQPTVKSKSKLKNQQVDLTKTGKQGAVYVNVEYGFQFTMPEKWIEIVGDYEVVLNKDEFSGRPFIKFIARATDNDWFNNQEVGFSKGYAMLFAINVIDKAVWDEDIKTCNTKENPCIHSNFKLGEKGANVFVLVLPQAGPSNFTMFKTKEIEIENPADIIKNGFELIST